MAYHTRLPLDAHVIGYWGFDEANETDLAVDESGSGYDLTVANAVSVVPARLGNGRQFDGASTRGDLAYSPPFRLNALTIIGWVTLDSVLQVGSRRRTIVACDGPHASPAIGGIFYYLGVDNTGAVIHEYHDALGRLIQWRTAGGALSTGRYYSIGLTRAINGNRTTLSLYVNNQAVGWVSITADGVPISDPVPGPALLAPATNQQTFKVGISDKYPDAFWHGVVDELSIHDLARTKSPYLDAAYFRLTLSTAFARLTAHGNVKTLGGVEMGGGTRWWCYERDQNVYVIRENSLGLFSNEILLTTTTVTAGQPPRASGTMMPRLAYDAASDTLLVAFIASGRVYKVTAKSGDAGSTQNMPGTADLAAVLKCVDQQDTLRVGGVGMPATQGNVTPPGPGGSGANVMPGGGSVLGAPVGVGLTVDPATAPTVTFLHTPTFGVVVEGNNAGGYFLYRVTSGVEVLIATLTQANRQTARYEGTTGSPPNLVGNYWFVPVAREYGATYWARPRTTSNAPGAAASAPITDYLGRIHTQDADETRLILSRAGDLPHEHLVQGPAGETPTGRVVEWNLITRTPLKIKIEDALTMGAVGEKTVGGDLWALVTRTPVKIGILDPVTIAAVGEANRATMDATGRFGG